MTAAGARGTLWSELVNGLLDARTDLATARFDAELAAAVDAGELSERTAHRLRFWQRASVNAADDHARTVVPTVMAVLDEAREHASAYVDGAAATMAANAPAEPTTDPRTSPGDDVPGLAPPEPPRRPAGAPPTAADEAGPLPPVGTVLEDLRRASSPDDDGPSTLVGASARLFVADLRDDPARSEQP